MKLHPFLKVRKGSSFQITNEHKDGSELLKADLVNAGQLPLKIAKPHCQFLIQCGASFYDAGYILLIEEPHDISTTKSKRYAR